MNGLVVVIEIEHLRLIPMLEERLGRQLEPEGHLGSLQQAASEYAFRHPINLDLE